MQIELDEGTAKALFKALSAQLSEQSAEVVKVPGQGDWTQEMIEQLREEIAPYSGAVALLDLAASRPDEEVRYFELRASAPKLSDRQVRSDLGAMTKAARRIFGYKGWPLRAWQAGDGVMTYVMPARIAEWWSGGYKKPSS